MDSHELEDIPPFGYAIDYMTYGGIYRDVWLYCCSQVFVERALLRYDLENKNAILKPELFLDLSLIHIFPYVRQAFQLGIYDYCLKREIHEEMLRTRISGWVWNSFTRRISSRPSITGIWISVIRISTGCCSR